MTARLPVAGLVSQLGDSDRDRDGERVEGDADAMPIMAPRAGSAPTHGFPRAVASESAPLDAADAAPKRAAKAKSTTAAAKRAAKPTVSPGAPGAPGVWAPRPAGRPIVELIADSSSEPTAALAAEPGPARLGELLPIPLTEIDLGRIAEYQQARRLRFGQAAVALGFASQSDVDWALSQQYSYAWVREGESAASPELVQAREPFGTAAEAFRDLRAHLMNQPELARRALAVVSTSAGDGRSFVAANLAIAFSQLGATTLLIDGDLRRPRQHALFGLPGHLGLSSLLAGRGPRNVVRRVPQLPGLHLLAAGAPPPNPLELLQQPSLTALLNEMVGTFDFVVIDTPAAAELADARVIAAACGAALAVARKDHTAMAALQDLAESMARLRTHFAGVVFNPR